MSKLAPILILFGLLGMSTNAQEKTRIYLVPGQGSDYRVFQKLELNRQLFDTIHIHFDTPEKHEDMATYARRLLKQIDTTGKFILIGYSLGGMLVSEMCSWCSPQKAIIIASAKSRRELPLKIRMLKYFPVHQLVPDGLIRRGAIFFQPKVDRIEKDTEQYFTEMIKDKEPAFLKRSIHMIARWNKQSFDNTIIHLHGANDQTLPIRNVEPSFILQDGNHKMVLARYEELNILLEKLIVPE